MIKKYMEGNNKQKQWLKTVDQFIKRRWPFLAIGAVFIIGASYGLFRYAVSHGNEINGQSQNNETIAEQTAIDDGLAARRLDGIRVAPELANLLPFAVMIENHVDARPLSGVSKASLVFEAPVEGGITRMLVIFDASSTADNIGPVRSARPYYIDWVRSLDAAYVHVGGSPEALNRIKGLAYFKNLDEMAGENYFWRSAKRSSPHNTYTSMENLNQAAIDKQWKAGDFEAWTFQEIEPDIKPGNVTSITIPYAGSYRVDWSYDPETASYERSMGRQRQKDADGSAVNAKNILVLSTEENTLDDVGRLSIRTTGEGKGWLFHYGSAKEIKWTRKSNQFYKIQSPDGRDVAFIPGSTWIEFATKKSYEPVFLTSSN
ncbi:MAG: DUF3048 domain-containing protein [Patescibacteria group bacterium]